MRILGALFLVCLSLRPVAAQSEPSLTPIQDSELEGFEVVEAGRYHIWNHVYDTLRVYTEEEFPHASAPYKSELCFDFRVDNAVVLEGEPVEILMLVGRGGGEVLDSILVSYDSNVVTLEPLIRAESQIIRLVLITNVVKFELNGLDAGSYIIRTALTSPYEKRRVCQKAVSVLGSEADHQVEEPVAVESGYYEDWPAYHDSWPQGRGAIFEHIQEYGNASVFGVIPNHAAEDLHQAGESRVPAVYDFAIRDETIQENQPFEVLYLLGSQNTTMVFDTVHVETVEQTITMIPRVRAAARDAGEIPPKHVIGYFELPGLPAGEYTLRLAAEPYWDKSVDPPRLLRPTVVKRITVSGD